MKKGLCMLLASAMIFGSMAGGIVEAKVPVEVPQIPVTETFSDIYNTGTRNMFSMCMIPV